MPSVASLLARVQKLERGRALHRGEQAIAQQPGDLTHRIRPAVSPRRRLGPRPQSAAIGDHDQQASAIGHDAPTLAHQVARVGRAFQTMHQQQPIN